MVKGSVVIGGTARDVSGDFGAADFVLVPPTVISPAGTGWGTAALASSTAAVRTPIAMTAPAPTPDNINFNRLDSISEHPNSARLATPAGSSIANTCAGGTTAPAHLSQPGQKKENSH
jgi:hypothetical protein